MTHQYLKVLVIWMCWLAIGTVFYSLQFDLGWSKGFYMAVNVGYAIGWVYPVENTQSSEIFSIIFILTGASAIAAALSFFAQSVINSSRKWYHDVVRQDDLAHESHRCMRVFKWLKANVTKIGVICLWVVWLVVILLYSYWTIRWSAVEALYFSVSSLSTAGLLTVPDGSPEHIYVSGLVHSCCCFIPHIYGYVQLES